MSVERHSKSFLQVAPLIHLTYHVASIGRRKRNTSLSKFPTFVSRILLTGVGCSSISFGFEMQTSYAAYSKNMENNKTYRHCICSVSVMNCIGNIDINRSSPRSPTWILAALSSCDVIALVSLPRAISVQLESTSQLTFRPSSNRFSYGSMQALVMLAQRISSRSSKLCPTYSKS
jgi:hypothetical protein